MNTANEPLQLMTVNQAAELLQVSTRTIRRLIESKTLTPIRIGQALRVQRRQVEHLASGNKNPFS